ncbi:MAG: endonuclease III [Herpetosiphon sp.]
MSTVHKAPLPANADSLEQKRLRAWQMYELVVETYGHQPNIPRREPMHELISTILSQRTTSQNEARAYEQMWNHYGSWAAVASAPDEELQQLIAPSNYAEQKAPRIKQVLQRIMAERGSANIDFLQTEPLDQALLWLMSLPGVGPKTASLVLLFCFARPVLPVDTHVHRVSQRVGLIDRRVDPTAAHPLLLALFPPDPQILYNFHIDTLRHGQRICTWSNPRCPACPLLPICDYGKQAVVKGT